MTKHPCFLSLLLLIVSTTAATAKPLRIVASIKPVHSLVASITHGVNKPELLMSSNQSPHHYSLKPSERKMLADADLVFWIGSSLESVMPRIFDSLENKNKSVPLILSQGLKLLPIRSLGDNHHETDQTTSRMDPHIWLNTENADILVDIITKKIIHLDPEHQQQYKANSQQLHNQISKLRKTLKQSLSSIKTTFLTYHDGYQYFENEFNLNNAGFVSTSELQPGARRIVELKKIIKEKNIECIFYDAPSQPPVLKLLMANGQTKALMLDPVGILIPPNKNIWFEVMNSMNKQFINCQQNH